MAHLDERSPLLGKGLPDAIIPPKHISVIFAVACIIDQFGVNAVIVLPRGIILCGWVGYPLALLVFSLTIYTAMLLGKCWVIAEHLDSFMFLKSRYAYSALTEMAWGKSIGKVINILINVSVFSSNIPALLIASQNLQFFDTKISNYTFNFSYCYWLIILGVALCPLTWLGSPKDTKWISVISAFSVLICALLTWISMVFDETRESIYDEIPSPNWQGISVAFGILTFQFGCHPAILTIQTDMHNKNQLSTSILLSFFATGGLALITVIMSAILYGAGTHANLTQGLPVSLVLYFDILVVTLQLFLSTIVGQCTLFQDVEDKLGVPRGKFDSIVSLFIIVITNFCNFTFILAITPRKKNWNDSPDLMGTSQTFRLSQQLKASSVDKHRQQCSCPVYGQTQTCLSTDDAFSCCERRNVWDVLIKSELCWQRCVVRSFIVGLVILFAEVLPRFDLVMGVIGGILTGPICLIFPPLLYMKFRQLLWDEKRKARVDIFIPKEGDIVAKDNLLMQIESHMEEQLMQRKFSRSIDSSYKLKIFVNKIIKFFSPEVNFNEKKLTIWENAMFWFIAAVGVLQTVTATYYSSVEAIQSTKFLPPCIVDVEAASGIINA